MSGDKSIGEQQFLTTSEMKEIRKTAEQSEGMSAAQRAAVPFTDGIVENRKKEIDAACAHTNKSKQSRQGVDPVDTFLSQINW